MSTTPLLSKIRPRNTQTSNPLSDSLIPPPSFEEFLEISTNLRVLRYSEFLVDYVNKILVRDSFGSYSSYTESLDVCSFTDGMFVCFFMGHLMDFYISSEN